MKELVKFELKKIFSNKLIYIAALAITLLFMVSFVAGIIQDKKQIGTNDEIKSMAEDYINGDYTKEDVAKLTDKAVNKVVEENKPSKDDYFLYSCSQTFNIADKNEKENSIKAVNMELNKLKDNNKDDTFKYKSLLKEKAMIKKLPKEKNLFIGYWKQALDFNVQATMKILLLVIGLAGIFTKEYTSRVANINLSTKKGRSQLNASKLIASLIYATIVFAFVTILYLIISSEFGLPNGSSPIKNVISSIYNISINQYFLGTLAFSYLGMLVFTMIIVLISLTARNIILEIILPIVLYFLPTIISLPHVISWLDYSRLFSGKSILLGYDSFNVFGNVVLYPYVIAVSGITAIVIMLFLYKRFGKTQTIV